MAGDYKPPEGTTSVLIFGLVFFIVGVAMIPAFITSGDFVILIVPIVFGGVGILLLWLYKDLRDPNGKYTMAGGNKKYTIMKRYSSPGPENVYGQNVNRDVPNANNQPNYNMPDYNSQNKKKRKKNNAVNSNGTYSYMNCPNCGSLNEAGTDKCRNCGKKL